MKTVCVTWASGYIASWLVKFLLQRGYTVKASVRDTGSHLLTFDGAKERLQLINADLLEEGSFDAVIDGCDGVFHTALRFCFQLLILRAELIDPALKGTLNVLRSCAKTPLVKRVVLTSSLAAIIINGKPRTPQVVVDETWWSDSNFVEKYRSQWYFLSKTLVEDAAWKFVKEKGLDMVAINPDMISLEDYDLFFEYAGAETYPNAAVGWVNVKLVCLSINREIEKKLIVVIEIPNLLNQIRRMMKLHQNRGT
ncbi:hypothetical protein CASFOL_011691 [Castilleja foliolosa]|uniref:Dihydroflavonol 4-reductase n=1 Tax=Castilleja foliolosa TaxID=1961234 RepID=A0ABD3E0B7_9LAMI